MLRLNDDGSITIADFESAQGDPVTVNVRAPKVGALKRLRAELRKISNAQNESDVAIDADESLSKDARLDAKRDWVIANLPPWWNLVLRGDESFRALTGDAVPDEDGWPPYMLAPTVIAVVMTHWESVPLARGEAEPAMLRTAAPPVP